MPVTVTLNPPAPFLSVGSTVDLQSSFVGPLPAGSFYIVETRRVADDPATVQQTMRLNVTTTHVGFSWLDPTASNTVQTALAVPDATPMSMVVDLHQPGAVIDSGRRDVVWDDTAGLYVQGLTSTTTGGFTTEDRALITTTQQQVGEELVGQVNPLLRIPMGIADVVLGFPVNRLAAFECASYTGRGVLTRSGGGFPVNAFGIRWRILAVPESFGSRDGALVEYIERLAQLVKFNHDTNGEEYVDDIVDIFSDGGKLAWSWNSYPSRVLYDVTPGVVMQFCWLLI